jgi:hypothetical protein
VVIVMGGTMRIGTGPTGDKTRTVAVPKGGFIHDIARGVHYDGSGNDPMWILTAGVGPTATVNVDPPTLWGSGTTRSTQKWMGAFFAMRCLQSVLNRETMCIGEPGSREERRYANY